MLQKTGNKKKKNSKRVLAKQSMAFKKRLLKKSRKENLFIFRKALERAKEESKSSN